MGSLKRIATTGKNGNQLVQLQKPQYIYFKVH